MTAKKLLVLALVVLLAVACGGAPAFSTPTPEGFVGVPTAVEQEGAPAVQATAATGSATAAAPGGVEVAIAKIQPVGGTLATVNGEEVAWADFEPELNRALYGVTRQYGVDWNSAEAEATLAILQDQVLQSVVDRTLIRQLAEDEGVTVTDADLQARIEQEKNNILTSGAFGSWDQFKQESGIGDEYFARLVEDVILIDQLGEKYGPESEVEQVHVRHILVETEEAGNDVLARLESGEEWEALAAEVSIDTSNKDKGGDLGWFPRGVMDLAFEEAAFSLEPGTTSDLVQTQFGYHIIEVLEKGTREVDEQMQTMLQQQAFQKWLNEKKAAADIQVQVKFAE